MGDIAVLKLKISKKLVKISWQFIYLYENDLSGPTFFVRLSLYETFWRGRTIEPNTISTVYITTNTWISYDVLYTIHSQVKYYAERYPEPVSLELPTLGVHWNSQGIDYAKRYPELVSLDLPDFRCVLKLSRDRLCR